MHLDYVSELRALDALRLSPPVRRKAVDLLKTGRYDASDAVHRARKETGSFKDTLDQAMKNLDREKKK